MNVINERQPGSGMHRKQRSKNLVMLLALCAFVVIVYLVTIVRLGGQ
jgi:hypothetical protein